jgi:hypothetical protein
VRRCDGKGVSSRVRVRASKEREGDRSEAGEEGACVYVSSIDDGWRGVRKHPRGDLKGFS